ncbi:MAG: glycosyltransferase family 39 protein [Chloroflexi bacterium]|nr:glycosyltransferase family 39 protein [Chloroflexota bacterium]
MKEKRLSKREHFWLCVMLAVTLAFHFAIIMQPSSTAFDEQHYVTDARSIIEGNGTQRQEHPDLAKLIIVGGIKLFGDNPFGWRFLSVVFGSIVIVLFYLICRRLGMKKQATLIATFLLSFENLTFIQSSVAMLDVYNVALMLAAFLLYLKGGYLLSGITAGLSALAKVGGILVLPAMFLHWFLVRRNRVRHFFAGLVIAPVFFFLFLPLFEYTVNGKFSDPIARIKHIFTASGSLTFEKFPTEIATRPWEWLLRPNILYYNYEPVYTGTISFTVWALIIPAVVYMVFRARKGNNAAIFGLAWFASTYLVWIPLNLITDRLTYLYYFYPTVGAVCIGLGLMGSQLLDVWRSERSLRVRRTALIAVRTYLVLHAVVFVLLSPAFSRWIPFFHYVPPPPTASETSTPPPESPAP